MGRTQSTQFKDLDFQDSRRHRTFSAWDLLRRLAGGLSPGRRSERTSAELTTQPPPTRGQAMREAHRTLRHRMKSHPAVRQVLPHLSVVERGLAKRGSRALMQLPVTVLQRALEQLALLQREDESPAEALNLRVLRLRLIEAIALRSANPGQHWPQGEGRLGEVHAGPDTGSSAENSDLSSSAFDEAEQAWTALRQRAARSGH